jgi:hypothetical protein
MQTLLLDTQSWDLVLDASGNIAVAGNPYSLAQDAASADRTFLGECYWDTTLGVDFIGKIFGKNIPLAILKQAMIDEALTVPEVVSANFIVQTLNGRTLTGQIQVVGSSGVASQATVFTTINPQGAG